VNGVRTKLLTDIFLTPSPAEEACKSRSRVLKGKQTQRPQAWPTSWAPVPVRCGGRFGRPCWSISYSYLAFLSNWAASFSRLFAVVRTCLWRKWDLLGLLARSGTAGGSFRYLARPEQAFFHGFA
jgi:hypothetical protein